MRSRIWAMFTSGEACRIAYQTMRVYTARLTCERNHCVASVAGEYPDLTAAEALRALLAERLRDPVLEECPICSSRLLHVELGASAFATLR
jgi:hypothetical protein